MRYDEWKANGPENYWVWDRTPSDDDDYEPDPEPPPWTKITIDIHPSTRYVVRVTDPYAEADLYLAQDYHEFCTTLGARE